MAFPTTPVLDDFNRADGGLGANWTAPIDAAESTPTVWTNAMVGVNSVISSAYWDIATFQNCEVYGTQTINDVGDYLWARVANTGTGTFCGFLSSFRNDQNLIKIGFYYDNALVTGDWLAQISTAVADGDQIGMTVVNVGNDIVCEVFLNGASKGSHTVTNGVTTYPNAAAAGYIGCGLYGGGNSLLRSLENFGGGTLSAQIILPDADIVTTGWATAPLFSKVNDSSDASVITATAS